MQSIFVSVLSFSNDSLKIASEHLFCSHFVPISVLFLSFAFRFLFITMTAVILSVSNMFTQNIDKNLVKFSSFELNTWGRETFILFQVLTLHWKTLSIDYNSFGFSFYFLSFVFCVYRTRSNFQKLCSPFYILGQ